MILLDFTMKFAILFGACFVCHVSAFSISPTSFRAAKYTKSSELAVSSTATSPLIDPPSAQPAKSRLLEVCRRLKSEYGVFIFDSTAKEELQSAVAEVENLSDAPGLDREYHQRLIGSWTLLCTMSTTDSGSNNFNLADMISNASPLTSIRDNIRKNLNDYLVVQQVIYNSRNDDGIDGIDHVIEYHPPAQLRDVLDTAPESLAALDINPLRVSQSKVILKHKASIDSVLPSLKIKLSLQSIQLNVAGTSTFLDPNGQDLFNIPLLFPDLTGGDFETTYMDKTIRISRGKRGLQDQLRVFVKEGAGDVVINNDVEVMDVDIDPEFVEDF